MSSNIILHRIDIDVSTISIKELIPQLDSSLLPNKILSIDTSGNVFWGKHAYNNSIDFIKDNRILNTDIFYNDGRLGISRFPINNYKFDIAVPVNTLMTALHIGDGKSGFSLGNGTSQGFIPEIIGMGSDENDAGLYLLGKSSNNLRSNTPLIIIDGRDAEHKALRNRPIIGVTSGDYSNYKFLIDNNGRVGIGKIPELYKLEVDGDIKADDLILGNISINALIDTVIRLQEEIYTLKNMINSLK